MLLDIASEDRASFAKALIAQQPKMAPHIHAMKVNIAAALGLSVDRVGVKATTNETLGFIGRGEGIAAMAVASVELPG